MKRLSFGIFDEGLLYWNGDSYFFKVSELCVMIFCWLRFDVKELIVNILEGYFYLREWFRCFRKWF